MPAGISFHALLPESLLSRRRVNPVYFWSSITKDTIKHKKRRLSSPRIGPSGGASYMYILAPTARTAEASFEAYRLVGVAGLHSPPGLTVAPSLWLHVLPVLAVPAPAELSSKSK